MAVGARALLKYSPMIKNAAALIHQQISAFKMDMIERNIAIKKEVDTNVIINCDKNTKADLPSPVILQYIPPTSLNYAMPGHTIIYTLLEMLFV
ncbi:hypothetical protein ATN92_10955 [Companilactobacillus bobalius]|nr:hypothetical protein ATN92_10955 [Companilactobacillus bobalius]